MKTITLTQGLVALVDDQDYEALAQHSWCAMHFKLDHVYAGRMIPTPDGPRCQRQVSMHRVLLGEPDGHVSHLDGDGLNNCRANLRTATRAEIQHRKVPLGGASRFKGVTWSQGRWLARLSRSGIRLYLGRFSTEEAAAMAYDRAAVEQFGELAQLNLPHRETGATV
jgi:hypothetical protein